MDQRHMTEEELLYTREGRAWLRKWCENTSLTGDANRWLARLEEAEQHAPEVK